LVRGSRTRRGSSPDEPRWLAFAAIALAAAALVAVLPGAFGRWFLPKETVFAVAVAAAAFLPAAGRLRRSGWIAIVGGALVLLIAALLSDSPFAQVVGRWPRYEGLVTLPVYAAAVWFGARMFGPSARGTRRSEQWLTLLAVAALALTAVSIAEAFGLRPIPSDLTRPGALLGNATDQGIVGAAIAVLLVAPAVRAVIDRRIESTVLLVAGGLGSLVTVALSGSRAGLLALGVGGLALFAAHLVVRMRSREPVRPLVVGSVVAITAVGTLMLVLPGVGQRVLGLTPSAGQTVADRFLIWNETLPILARDPLFGAGPSGYLDAIAIGHGEQWYRTVTPGTTLDSPHNLVLQALSAGGVPLLLCALALAGLIVVIGARRLWNTGTKPPARPARGNDDTDLVAASLAGLAAILIALLTHFTSAATGILAGTLVGILLAVAPATEPRAFRRVRGYALLAWAALLALATSADFSIESALRAPTSSASDDHFRSAQALRPWDGDLASIAAQSFTARADSGDPAAAAFGIAWAERALVLIPDSTATRLALGTSLRLDGRMDEAIAVLEPLAESIPLDRDVAVQLGIAHAYAGDHAAALSLWESVLDLHPDDTFVLELLERLP
jgi:O-antigen ligase